MENACLTFATPSLLAGDKSAVSTVAHEISHVGALAYSGELANICSLGSVMVLAALLGLISG